MKKQEEKVESIVLGGGCFWCLDAVFSRVKGIVEVVSGYAGGDASEDGETPTYQQVCSGKTGHAETVQITFDPAVIALEDILHIFFSVHDPTTLNRQGNDVGSQYRSIILWENASQHDKAEKIMREIAEQDFYQGMIVTELKKLEKFYPAEDYHQKYFEKNPHAAYCQITVSPKIAKLREKFSKFYQSS